MTDDINGLKRLFSDKEDDDKKSEPDIPENGMSPSTADLGPENEGQESPSTDTGEPTDDIWAKRKRFGSTEEQGEEPEPEPQKPEKAADAEDSVHNDPVREIVEKPLDPPSVEKTDAREAFDRMAIENLRRQKQESEEEKKEERRDTPPEDTRQSTPAWAIKADDKGPKEEPSESPPVSHIEDDQPEDAVETKRWPIADKKAEEISSSPPEPDKVMDVIADIRADMSADMPENPGMDPAEASYDDEPDTHQEGDAEQELTPEQPELPEMVDTGQDVNELRDLLFKGPAGDDGGKPKKKKPVYVEPTLEINPLVSFIGLIGAICIGIAFMMTILGAKAGLGITGLSGVGVLMLFAYAIGNGRNLKLVLSARSTRHGANVTFVILTLLAILVVLNGISYGHYYVMDMTSNKSNSLSEQTLKVLQGLRASGQTVKATAFIKGEAEFRGQGNIIEETLNKYSHILPNLEITYLDPDVHRQRADDYNFEQPVGVVFELGDKNEQAIAFSPKSGWWEYEAAFTDALLRLTGVHAKKVYFLTGHKELSTDDFAERSSSGVGLFVSELESKGFQVENLSLAARTEIPDDCNLLIVAGPERKLPGEQIDAVSKYIDSGGRVMLLLEYRNDAGFAPMLEEFGIHYRSDLIADDKNNQAGSNNLHPLLELSNHPINVPLKNQNMEIFFFRASGMDVEAEPKRGWILERLLSTRGGGSWSETGQSVGVIYDEGQDERGPFTVAVIAGKPVTSTVDATLEGDERPAGGAGSNLGLVFVAGDASFVANKNLYSGGGSDFILNSASYLTSDIPDLSIRAQEPQKFLRLTKTQVNITFLISGIFVPLLIAALGVFVWVKRR